MSDSDSDDGFSSLITNGEENFWKSYKVDEKVKHKKCEKVTTTPSTSGSSDGPGCAKQIARRKTSTRHLSPEPATAASYDTSDNSNATASPPKSKKIKTETTANSDAHNSLLSTVLKTLAQANIPNTNEAQPSTSNNLSEAGPSSLSTRVTRSQRRATNNLFQPEHVPPVPRTKRKRNPKKKNQNCLPTVIDAIDLLENGSKTPPYQQPSTADANPVIELKVLWKAIYLKIFKIRRFTPLKEIVDYFAKKENVSPNVICFSINDKIVNLSLYSCVTLKYQSHCEIEGSICNDFDINHISKLEDGTKLKVRLKKTIENIVLNPDVILEHLYAQVVLKFNLTFGKFILQFDGQVINYFDTIRTLELEENDCIDIMLI